MSGSRSCLFAGLDSLMNLIYMDIYSSIHAPQYNTCIYYYVVIVFYLCTSTCTLYVTVLWNIPMDFLPANTPHFLRLWLDTRLIHCNKCLIAAGSNPYHLTAVPKTGKQTGTQVPRLCLLALPSPTSLSLG